MAVPFCDPRRAEAPLHADMQRAVQGVIESGRYILGPEVEAFEAELAAWVGVKHAVGVSSGTDALLVCLMALGIGPGDAVLAPSFSFFATIGGVLRLGAQPRFVDIEANSFLWDAEAAVAAQDAPARAAIPVDLFGAAAPLPAALQVPIIEDAAQNLVQAPLGSLARCLSFFPTKNLGGCGDGGAVLTNDAGFAQTLRELRAHGATRKYHHTRLGGNFRLDALQAALLRVKLPHLSAWIDARRAIAARYRGLCDAYALAAHGVRMPSAAPGHSYNQFVIRAPRRDALQAHLNAAGIGSVVYYPSTLPAQPCVQAIARHSIQRPEPADASGEGAGARHDARGARTPVSTGGQADKVAQQAAAEVLALPCFVGLTAAEQEAVVAAVAAFYR